ncbi:MAG: hypothetical protein CMP30_00430 [Roseibacillus sp.]|nr:hypothetical protein [Roseibacillus sp.]HCQ38485.1 hypothetical protein [Verrucomicrobiales bacterium]
MKKLSDKECSIFLTIHDYWTKEAAKGTAVEYQAPMSEIPEDAPILNKVEGENHAPPPGKEFLSKWAKYMKRRKAHIERLRRARKGAPVRYNKNRQTILRHLGDFVDEHRAFPSTGELAEQFGYETGSGIYAEASETLSRVRAHFDKLRIIWLGPDTETANNISRTRHVGSN